jgi:hypothetical protein
MLVHDIKGGRPDAQPPLQQLHGPREESIAPWCRRYFGIDAGRLALLYDSFATETLLLALLTRGKHHGFKRFAKALGVAHP